MAFTRNSLEGFVEARMRVLRSLEYVRSWSFEQQVNQDAYLLKVRMTSGEDLRYTLTGLERLHDGAELWLDTVSRDISARWAQRIPDHMFATACVFSSVVGMYIGGWDAPDPQAETKAAELFKMACGKEAFDTLNSMQPLPITGSKGTKYTLHKRATYCVERVKDKAKLCAVVPGVPLWDHLLGIKLMIEHDEPKFLETANEAQGFGGDQYVAQIGEEMRSRREEIAQKILQSNSLLQRLRNMI